MNCSPQRFLPNSRNLFATAALTPSSVLPIANQVPRVPYPRSGTAQAMLTGIYTGFEEALYEFQIVDTTVEVARVSKPTGSGAGSGTVTDITATGSQQILTLECQSASIDAAAATVQIDGATIKAASEGTDGNSIRIAVDQSALVFTDTNFSTVNDLEAGQGSDASPLIGPAFNWDTAQIANGQIPVTAHRIAFADDPGTIYTNYKDFIDGEDKFYLIPSLSRTVPKGTRIQFVTGGRTVAVSTLLPAPATETVSDIVTDFDFLNWIRLTSQLLIVTTPVPNDRSPTGLAAREFSLRTDAHAGVSTGSGSSYATGFIDVTVKADAGTQLVTAECFAVTGSDSPNARLGSELWRLKSSLLGDLGVIATGQAFDGAEFGLKIPVRLPPGFGQDRGSIGYSIAYASRSEGQTEPPICVKGLRLGSDATDKTVTFRYSPRPTGGACDCTNMPVPPINSACLGAPSEGGASVSYLPDTVTRLIDLYDRFETLVRDLTEPATASTSAKTAPAIAAPADAYDAGYQAVIATDAPGVLVDTDGDGTGDTLYRFGLPVPGASAAVKSPAEYVNFMKNSESIKAVVQNWEAALAQIDPLLDGSPETYRSDGVAAWDIEVALFWTDIDAMVGASSPFTNILNIPSERYAAAIMKVLMTAGISTLGKADASTVSGDGCWRDFGGSAWWADVEGVYQPLFTNERFYFCKKTVDGGVRSSHEATGAIMVECVNDLRYGDEVTVRILNASQGSTYQVGDKEEQPIIAAAALPLTGGVNPAPTQTWTLNGSVDGPFPPYTFNPDAPLAYAGTVGASTIGFILVEGGIPPAKGDRFRWAVEGGHYRWRVNGGAWQDASPPAAIPLVADLIDEGLSLAFAAGAAASFVLDDLYKFLARQPWAVSNTQTPSDAVWKWDGADVTYAADFGAPQPITMFAMLHTLPEGATITLNGGLAAANEWAETITWRPDAAWKEMDQTARYVSLAITNATGGSIQWPWAGVPLTTALSSEFIPTVDYQINRPSGNLQGGRYLGRGIAGEVVWTPDHLSDADIGWSTDDVDGLRAMFDELKRNDDEPFLFVPQVTRVADPVIFARLGSDSLRFEDVDGLGLNEGRPRHWTVTLPLAPVYR